MSVADWVTMAAIVLGPIFGAALALWMEDRRETRQRRLDIFRTLMRTRRTPLWPDHVGALNLVEIEFYKHPKVVSAWSKYFDHLCLEHPRREEEVTSETMHESEQHRRNQSYGTRIAQERSELLTALLHSIASVVGFGKMQQLEMLKGGYAPKGWEDIEIDTMLARRLFADIATGHKVLPISIREWPNQPQVIQSAEETARGSNRGER